MRLRAQNGASAVEFALLLPVLVLLVAGIMQFGFIFSASQGLEAAAREGGRVAALGRDADRGAVFDAVRGTSIPFVRDNGVLGITAGPRCPDGVADGDLAEISVEVSLSGNDYGFSLVSWRGNRLLNPDLEATATFRCEAPHTSW